MISTQTQFQTLPMRQLVGLLPVLQWNQDPSGFLEAWLRPNELKVQVFSSELYRSPTRLIRTEPYAADYLVLTGDVDFHQYRRSTQIGRQLEQLVVLPTGKLSRRGLVRLVASDTQTYGSKQRFHITAGAPYWVEARWAVVLVAVTPSKEPNELPAVFTEPGSGLVSVSSPVSPLLWQPMLMCAATELMELTP